MVFVDDAQPANISREIAVKRKDIRVLKVLAHVPGLNPNFDFGLGTPGDVTFTCLAETSLLASLGRDHDYTVGYVDHRDTETIGLLAKEMNVHLPEVFYSFDGARVTVEQIREMGGLWKA
jgi:predicted amino acid dehydrogenase